MGRAPATADLPSGGSNVQLPRALICADPREARRQETARRRQMTNQRMQSNERDSRGGTRARCGSAIGDPRHRDSWLVM